MAAVKGVKKLISIDYDKAMSQAKQLEEAAGKCTEAADKIQQERGAMETAWQGGSGKSMIEQLLKEEKNLRKSASTLSTTAAEIRKIAKEFKNKDVSLKNIFK